MGDPDATRSWVLPDLQQHVHGDDGGGPFGGGSGDGLDAERVAHDVVCGDADEGGDAVGAGADDDASRGAACVYENDVSATSCGTTADQQGWTVVQCPVTVMGPAAVTGQCPMKTAPGGGINGVRVTLNPGNYSGIVDPCGNYQIAEVPLAITRPVSWTQRRLRLMTGPGCLQVLVRQRRLPPAH